MNDSKTARDVIVDALTARHEELSGEASPRDFDGASRILRALGSAGFVVTRRDQAPTYTESRKREYVHGYLMDGRTIDLVREHASSCGRSEAHEVHWPDLEAGEGDPAVPVAGTYVCPGVPPHDRSGVEVSGAVKP
jgi:hypothetical protein